MSILIKGMAMPKSCRYCAFRHLSLTQNAFCTAAHETIDYVNERTKRLDNCPIVPVPAHGALIDRDEFFATCPELVSGYKTITDELVVIPAEEGE